MILSFPNDVAWRYASLYKTSYRYAERVKRKRARERNIENNRFRDGSKAIYVVACRIISRYDAEVFSERGIPYWLDAMSLIRKGETRIHDICWIEEIRVATDWKDALRAVRELQEEYPSSQYGRHAVIGDVDTEIRLAADPAEVQRMEYHEGYGGCN